MAFWRVVRPVFTFVLFKYLLTKSRDSALKIALILMRQNVKFVLNYELNVTLGMVEPFKISLHALGRFLNFAYFVNVASFDKNQLFWLQGRKLAIRFVHRKLVLWCFSRHFWEDQLLFCEIAAIIDVTFRFSLSPKFGHFLPPKNPFQFLL